MPESMCVVTRCFEGVMALEHCVLANVRPALGSPASARSAESTITVALIGGFRVTCGDRNVDIPPSTRRLVAFLALAQRLVERSYVANCLWLDKSDDRAQANLRSSLWRLRQCGLPLVEVTSTHIQLDPAVLV